MELKDTVGLMTSSDYVDRFAAEYWQLNKRINGLHKMVIKYSTGTLDFNPDSPLILLKQQLKAMREYRDVLEMRAEYEKIDLYKYLPDYNEEENKPQDNQIFSVGSTHRVRRDIAAGTFFGNYIIFTEEMAVLSGEEVTISSCRNGRYTIAEDFHLHIWAKEMFEN